MGEYKTLIVAEKKGLNSSFLGVRRGMFRSLQDLLFVFGTKIELYSVDDFLQRVQGRENFMNLEIENYNVRKVKVFSGDLVQ